MKDTTIYFLRHGEVYNPKKILYGRLPRFGLAERGKERITRVARYFKDKNINVLYSSPLLRSRQTALIIGQYLGLKVKISSLVNEVKLFCEGVSSDVYNSQIRSKLYDRENIVLGQESIDSIVSRMMKFLQLICLRHKGDSVLVVSHGDPIMILQAELENIPFTWEYKKEHYLNTGDWIKVVC